MEHEVCQIDIRFERMSGIFEDGTCPALYRVPPLPKKITMSDSPLAYTAFMTVSATGCVGSL